MKFKSAKNLQNTSYPVLIRYYDKIMQYYDQLFLVGDKEIALEDSQLKNNPVFEAVMSDQLDQTTATNYYNYLVTFVKEKKRSKLRKDLQDKFPGASNKELDTLVWYKELPFKTRIKVLVEVGFQALLPYFLLIGVLVWFISLFV